MIRWFKIDMKSNLKLLLIILIILSPFIILSDSPSLQRNNPSNGCTCVIVTGSASAGEWAVLAKNRDWSDLRNKPVYVPSKTIVVDGESVETYAYTAVNTYWMGMNERGLAVVNSLMTALEGDGQGYSWDNGELNQKILELCDSVEQVCQMLNETNGIIGPNNRGCATCIGVIDRLGNGAFIEVSPTEAYAEHVSDGYQSRANHPRIFPGKAQGPRGRDQYALDIMDEIHNINGEISYRDVIQEVMRCVRNKEQGDECFTIYDEVCNYYTQASFVAISGEQRYSGKLNCFWGEYGNPPMVGLFVPSIPFAGEPPLYLTNLYEETWIKRDHAQETCGGYYNPLRVREIQNYTFEAEQHTYEKFEELIATIPGDLSDETLRLMLVQYINDATQFAVNLYKTENIPEPPSVGGEAYIILPISACATQVD